MMGTTDLEKFRNVLRDMMVGHKEFISTLIDYHIGVDPNSITKIPEIQSADAVTTKCISMMAEKPNGKKTIVEFHFDTGRNELIKIRVL